MNIKFYLPTLLLFFTINIIQSQQKVDIDSNYKEYFSSQREVPYLHLNKTTFIEGEEIWFKSYVYNLNNKKLHKNTNNLYVSLYDKKGDLKEKKILYIENGIGTGSFRVDSTFSDNEYYIKASTNWMKNFKEDESYIQKISILKSNAEIKKTSELKYDIQFLPESGHMLESIENTIGVIVKNSNDEGVKITEGKILDNEKNLITIFTTNSFGIGSFDFIPETGKNYKAEITFSNDSKITKDILPSENKGVALTIYNPNTTFVSIIIKTNKVTLTDLVDKKYSLYVHNIAKTIKQEFTFTNETLEYNINLNPKKLEPGINIVTLFDDNNRPVAERLFFNYKENSFKKPLISTSKSKTDSTLITFSKKIKNNETYYLSASILPEETKSYNPNSNIASKFLIEPFINGQIENPDYYFKNINRRKLMNLDLLLLTQGWSKYKWTDIFNNPPKELFENENGFTVKGTTNSSKRSRSVFLVSKENNLILSTPIIDNKFTFKKLYLKEDSKISFSTKQGQRIKQDKFNISYFPLKVRDKINPIDIPFSSNKVLESNLNYGSFISDDIIALNDVIIESKKQEKDRKILTIVGPSRSFKIDKDSPQDLSIFTYIRQLGFNVNRMSNGGYSIFTKRPSVSLTQPKPTMVYLDYNLIQDETYNSLDQLNYLTLKDFEEVVVSKTAFGSVHLFSNFKIDKKDYRNRFSESYVPFGYATEKEYYQPQYSSFQDSFFKKNGAINWLPKIKIENGKTSFKILNLGQKNIRIFLEGITSDGNIILEDQIIELK